MLLLVRLSIWEVSKFQIYNVCRERHAAKAEYNDIWPENSRMRGIGSFSLLSRSSPSAKTKGPWAKRYTCSVPPLLTSRLLRLPFTQPWAHLELGSLALQILSRQWKNTKGFSPMNLKASKLNRWTWTEGACSNLTVSSTAQLKENKTYLKYIPQNLSYKL